jgi:hypothetical protein
VSKRPPELTWQDKAILITIPLVVLAIFVLSNFLSRDLGVSDAFQQRLPKSEVRDGGSITQVLPVDPVATSTLQCRVRTRDGSTEFLLRIHALATHTPNLQVGRQIQFFGEYSFDEKGGAVDAPFKGKSGRSNGWVIYDSERYYHPDSGDNPL